MPDGSSSAAPVMIPGPMAFRSDRIHREPAEVGALGLGPLLAITAQSEAAK
jgi:hypothetical protein